MSTINDGKRYPGSMSGQAARRYGPLPDYGSTSSPRAPAGSPVALILHTTETAGIPGYGGGDSSPHYTYLAAEREWVWHAALDARVGTMKGGSSDRPYANDKAIQVEIVCYSDKSVADGSSSRLWVGDLSDENYQDLADFARWCHEGPHAIELVGLPTPAGGWLYGTSSPHRQSEAEWYAYAGIGCHGSVPGQTHWDTGVLDLQRVAALATSPDGPEGEIPEPPPDPEPEESDMWPLNAGDHSDDVQYARDQLNYLGHDLDPAGRDYDDAMVAAVAAEFPNNAKPEKLNGRQGAILARRVSVRAVWQALKQASN